MKKKNKSNRQSQKVLYPNPPLPETQISKIDPNQKEEKRWNTITLIVKLLGAIAGLCRLAWEIMRSWGQSRL